MSALPLNREELLQDSQATLRKVAGILDELWDLRKGAGRHDALIPFQDRGSDIDLTEIQAMLDRLTYAMGRQGMGME